MPRVSNKYGVLQGEDDDDYSSENYAENITGDVGANGFASDKELYAEMTRKQQGFQTAPSLASLSPSLCTATKATGQTN